MGVILLCRRKASGSVPAESPVKGPSRRGGGETSTQASRELLPAQVNSSGAAGPEVWLSTRPLHVHSRVYPGTLLWLLRINLCCAFSTSEHSRGREPLTENSPMKDRWQTSHRQSWTTWRCSSHCRTTTHGGTPRTITTAPGMRPRPRPSFLNAHGSKRWLVCQQCACVFVSRAYPMCGQGLWL